MLTLGEARGDPRALAGVLEAFDVRTLVGARPGQAGVNIAGAEHEVEHWSREFLEGFRRSPAAAVVAAQLVRQHPNKTQEGLLNESAAYAMLQGSKSHRAWLRSRPAQPPHIDSSENLVKVANVGSTVELSLNRPHRHNALNAAMRDELFAILDALRHKPEVGIVLQGIGRSFCSGGDLTEFGVTTDSTDGHLVRATRSLPLMVDGMGSRLVAGVHGACVGAGIELAAFASRVVAADDTSIWLPEASFGLIPGSGGTVSIPRRVGSHRFIELFVTGKELEAATAAQWGLVDAVVPGEFLKRRLRRTSRFAAESDQEDVDV